MNLRRIRFKRAFWWCFFAIWLILTVFLSSQAADGSSALSREVSVKLWRVLIKIFGDFKLSTFHFYVRKFAHAFVHLVLAFAAIRASLWSFSERKAGLWFAVLFSVFIALFDEAIQLISPGRSSALLDGAINLLGVLIGSLISSRFGPKALSDIT